VHTGAGVPTFPHQQVAFSAGDDLTIGQAHQIAHGADVAVAEFLDGADAWRVATASGQSLPAFGLDVATTLQLDTAFHDYLPARISRLLRPCDYRLRRNFNGNQTVFHHHILQFLES